MCQVLGSHVFRNRYMMDFKVISSNLSKMHIFSLFLIGAFFLGSCAVSTDPKDPLLDFQDEVNLTSKRLKTSDSLYRAGGILVFDDVLFVYDNEMDYLYKIIAIDQDQLLKRFGKVGQGPCELDPSLITYKSGADGKLIGMFEMGSREFQEYSVKEILESKDDPACIPFQGKIDSEISLAIKVREDIFLGVTNGKPYALLTGNQVVQTIGEFPFQEQFEGIHPFILELAYQNKLHKHPTKSLFLGTSTFSFNMDILELNNEDNLVLKKSLHFWPTEFEPSNDPNQFFAAIKAENRFGNVSTSVSENYIYVLYSDEPWEYQFPLKSKRVLVYDWEGNPIRILQLDTELSMIAVHEKDEFLIGYVDDGRANLYQFKLD
ncbi:MAG: hypothetical protein ACI8SN_000457 [Algoriphagus sp.]|jgi:hypothetical protein